MDSRGKLTVQRVLVAVFWSAVAVASFKAYVEYGPSTARAGLLATLILVFGTSSCAVVGSLLGYTRRGIAIGVGVSLLPSLYFYWLLLKCDC